MEEDVPRPEDQAREQIDRLLKQAGWQVCDPNQVNLHAYRGIAIQGLPDNLPRWHNPLPFSYQSTGVETRFTNGLDPDVSRIHWAQYVGPSHNCC